MIEQETLDLIDNINCLMCIHLNYCIFNDDNVPMCSCPNFKVDMKSVKCQVLPDGFSEMILSSGCQI